MAALVTRRDTNERTITLMEQEEGTRETLVLRLKKPPTDKKVQWEEGVVDNEFMGKKTSKCCCIYDRPHVFGESSTDSDDSSDDCCHEMKSVRKKRRPRKRKQQPSDEHGQHNCPHHP